MRYKTTQIAGIYFVDSTLGEFSELICSSVSNGENLGSIHLVPAGSIYFANIDPVYFNLLTSSICLPDGKSITFASRFFGHKISQIRGTDFFKSILSFGRTRNLSHFLLGTTEENLENIIQIAKSRFPGIKFVGKISPPYRPLVQDEIDTYCNEIKLSNADLVWVGLGSPQQDLLASKLSEKTGKTVIAVGAAFDFFTGTQKEAPSILRKLGLEWFYRLCQNPGRLWKRYLIGNFVFVLQVILWKLFPQRQQIKLQNKLFIQTLE